MKIKLSELRQLIKSVIKEQVTTNVTTNTSIIPGSNKDSKFVELKNKLNNVKYKYKERDEDQYTILGFGNSGLRPQGMTPQYNFNIISATYNSPLYFKIGLAVTDKDIFDKLENFWKGLGYKMQHSYFLIDINNTDKFVSDLKSFFNKFPPEKPGGEKRKVTDADKLRILKSIRWSENEKAPH